MSIPVYVDEDPVGSETLGAMAGDRVPVIEVALRLGIERDRFSCIHLGGHDAGLNFF